jgi:hypothetical protein
MANKTDTDSKRNTFVHTQAFRWLEKNRPDVVQACREIGEAKYPRTGKARPKIELADELAKLK